MRSVALSAGLLLALLWILVTLRGPGPGDGTGPSVTWQRRNAATSVEEALTEPGRSPSGRAEASAPVTAVVQTLRVDVTSRVAARSDADVVPRTALVVGVGWATGGPRATHLVPGDYPDVRHVVDRTALASLRTDGAGRGAATLELTGALAQADLVWVEVVEPGRWRWISFAARPDDETELALTAIVGEGWTLRGRVVDESGALVPGSRVDLHRAGDPRRFTSMTTRDDGRIELHRSGAGGTFDLVASRPQVGVAARTALELDPRVEPPYVELVLRGAGRISGTLVDPVDRPLVGQRIHAVAVANPDEASAAEGLDETRATTGPAGEFELTGLCPGDYTLYGERGGQRGEELDLVGEPVKTGTEGLRLVASLHVLRVRVTDEAGRPLDAVPQFRAWDWQPGPWRGAVHVYVHEADEAGAVLEADRLAPGRRATRPDGAVDVTLAPGRSYVVGALSPERSLVEREVFVGASEHLVEVELELGPPRPAGRLTVEVLDPSGRPQRSRPTSVEVFAPESGKLLFVTPRAHFEPEFEVVLPPGRYRVVAGAPSLRGQHGGRAAEKFLPVEESFDVRAGETLRWGAQVRAAGRLRLTVTLAGEPDALGYAEVRARLASGGAERRPLFGIDPGIVSLPLQEKPRVPIGRATEQLDVLPPGRWIVRVEREGYAPAEVPVTIVGGEVTPVEVTLVGE